MEIYKILNNNVIVSKNEHDKEIIAMGKGIAFKKKVGEHIEDELIDKFIRYLMKFLLNFRNLLQKSLWNI